MSGKTKTILPGILFITVGVWLLARHLMEGTWLWWRVYPVVLILFSAALFEEAVRCRRSGYYFWGTILLAVGLFYLARNYRWIPYFFPDEYWPLFIAAAGLGFVVQFVVHPADWGILIPAGVLLFAGCIFASFSLYGDAADWAERVAHAWPVWIVLVGAGLIVRGLRNR